jgi:hypothetical protein
MYDDLGQNIPQKQILDYGFDLQVSHRKKKWTLRIPRKLMHSQVP